MKIDLSKNKKSNNDENKKDNPLEKLTGNLRKKMMRSHRSNKRLKRRCRLLLF
jgi:hypothetical protein